MDIIQVILIVYFALAAAGSIFIAFAWFDDMNDEVHLVWFPMWILRNLKERLNLAGYIILAIFSNILLAPATILAILMVGITIGVVMLPVGFTYLFRKR